MLYIWTQVLLLWQKDHKRDLVKETYLSKHTQIVLTGLPLPNQKHFDCTPEVHTEEINMRGQASVFLAVLSS